MTALQQFYYRFDLPLIMMALVGLALSACEMTSESYISTAPIEIRHDRYNEVLPVQAVNNELAQMMGRHYDRFGQGPMNVTVTYPVGTSEMKAQKEGARIAKLMNKAGINDVQVTTLPVNDPEQSGQAMINYMQVTAHPPKGCDPHPAESRDGLVGSADGRFTNYRFGCGVDTYIAQQVVRPKDLLGNETLAQGSADRASARLDDYRTGKNLEKLSATNASEE